MRRLGTLKVKVLFFCIFLWVSEAFHMRHRINFSSSHSYMDLFFYKDDV
jgi:hypothetical protein